jgi:hypothetical protein
MLPGHETWTEWCASRITDPLARLRYLRRKQRTSPRPALLCTALTALGFCASFGGIRTIPPQPASSAESAPPSLVSVNLRVQVRHHRRSYVVFRGETAEPRNEPAGIVFHSTEGLNTPPEYLARRRSYHFLISRSGEIHAIVRETDSADHAGNSAWAWDGAACVNLNHAFLGVAFDGHTGEPLTREQLLSGRALVAALRARFHIPARNCVTHAQVSLNPANARIGWHTDWGRDFPFLEMGLPDNYSEPLASVTEFGFVYDPAYLNTASEGLWVGVHRSESYLKQRSETLGVPLDTLRKSLRRRYQLLVAKESLS